MQTIDDIAAVAAKLVLEQLDAQHRPDDGNSLMTVVEAADYLRCKPQRIYDLVSSQRLPKYKDGTRTLVKREDLDVHLRS